MEENSEPNRYQKFQQHLKDNKKVYLGMAGGLAVGYLLRRPNSAAIINNVAPSIAPNIAPVFNNTVSNGSYARKIIRCIETDELWPSMSKAAEAAGHTLQAMSRHIHGYNDHLDGLHYVIEGLSAS